MYLLHREFSGQASHANDRITRVALICLFWGLACYGFSLFKSYYIIDDEYIAFHTTPLNELLHVGRWAGYAWQAVISPSGLVPVIPGLISIVCIVFGGVVTALLMRPKSEAATIAVALLFISYPIHAVLVSLNAGYTIYLGFACAVLSVYLLTTNSNWPSVAASAGLGALAIGSYQSNITLMLALCLGYLLALVCDAGAEAPAIPFREQAKRFALRASIYFAGSVALYKLVDGLVKLIVPAPEIVGLYNPSFARLFAFDVYAAIALIPREVAVYYSSGLFALGDRVVIVGSEILAILAAIHIGLLPVSLARRGLGLVGIVLLMLSPFVLDFAIGVESPSRSHVALPAVLAVLAGIALRTKINLVRGLIFACIAIVALRMAVAGNRIMFAQQVSYLADRDAVQGIARTAEETAAAAGLSAPIPLAFVGALQRPQNNLFLQIDAVGRSFLSWGPQQAENFIRTMGLNRFRLVGVSPAMKDKMAQAPVWPQKGSVEIVDGAVVVKLSK